MVFFLPCLSLSTLLFYYVTPYVVLVGKHWKTVFQCVAAPAASSIFLNAVEITIIWNPDVEKTLSLWITKWAGQSRRMGTMAGRWSEGQRWKRKEKKRKGKKKKKTKGWKGCGERGEERAGRGVLLFGVFESSRSWLGAWPNLRWLRATENNCERARKRGRLLRSALKGSPQEVLILPRARHPPPTAEKNEERAFI